MTLTDAQKRANREMAPRRKLNGSGPSVRLNISLPRELYQRFKEAYGAISPAIAEMMRERLRK